MYDKTVDCYVTCGNLRNVREQIADLEAKYDMSRKVSHFCIGCGMFLGALAFFIGMMIARLTQ